MPKDQQKQIVDKLDDECWRIVSRGKALQALYGRNAVENAIKQQRFQDRYHNRGNRHV